MTSKYVEFRYGGAVVFASAVGIGLGLSPLPFYTLGVFAGPIAKEFGWGMGQIMLAPLMTTIGAVVMGPIIGQITDKVGPRRVVLTSLFLFSLAMMSFAFMNGSLAMWLSIWGVVAVCGSGTLPIAWTRAVNNWFFEKRGLALGLSLIGTGLFGLLAKFYAFHMIQLFGWRGGYVAVGALPLVIAWPVAYFMFRDVSDPKVAEKAAMMERLTVSTHLKMGGLTLLQALKEWRFWLIAACFFPISFAVGGPIPNLETIFGTKGFTPEDAVTLAGLIGIAVIIGRVVGGFLLDYIWAPIVAATILSLPAIAALMLAQPEISFLTAAVATMILGAAAGVEYDLMAYLVSRYFGMLHYAAIYGAVYGFFALGAGLGPTIFGRFYESLGNYNAILKISAVLFLVGAIPLLFLGKYRDYTPNGDQQGRVD